MSSGQPQRDYRTLIERRMHDLGEDALLPADEETEGSKWATEDLAPSGVAGYYIRARVPLPHRIVTDGRGVVLRFSRGSQRYEIRCRHKTSQTDNMRAIACILDTLLGWIADGILVWDGAFYGFRIEESEGEWWRVLRVAPDATTDEIEAAFRRQALQVHPDRGGTHEAFLRLQQAYEIGKKLASNNHRG